jgi:hypothetical protein
MTELKRLIGWFRTRVTIHNAEADYLEFVMKEYAKLYHKSEIEKLNEVVEQYLKSENACTEHAMGIRDFVEYLKIKNK